MPRPFRVPNARVRLAALLLVCGGWGCDSAPSGAPEATPAPAKAPEQAEAEGEAKVVEAEGEAKAAEGEGVAALVEGYRGAPGDASGGPTPADGEATLGADDEVPVEVSTEGMVGLGPLPTGVLAVVGTEEIPMSAFHEIYGLKVAKYAERGREIPPSADRRYRKSIAERLINQVLLAQEAGRLGVDYDPAELAEREAEQRRGIRDWAKHLARRGETEQSLRAIVVAELREKAILDHLGELAISEAEIDADYDKIKENWRSEKKRVRASHILVPVDASGSTPSAADEAKARKTANEIHAEVTRPGADFAEVARRRSTGPSAAKGGDIGIFTADRMAEDFSSVAFKMKVGKISKPVKTKFGFHIIKVTGQWPPGVLPREALEDQIRERLRQRKLHKGRRDLIERLRDKATIVDHMAPTLGPEPRRRPRSPEPGEEG